MDADDLNDDMLIDKLVDGELMPEERRQLLVQLEAAPDGWRRCALAFVESQAWQSGLRVFAASTIHNESDPDTMAVRTLKSGETRRSDKSPRSAARRLALAAGLLLAFGLGRQFGVGERSQLNQAQIAESAAPPAAPDDRESPKATDQPLWGFGNDAVTLVVNDYRGAPHRVRVPLLEARELGAEFAAVPTWTSPELLQRLDQQGLGLAARRRYAPLYFEQQDQRIPFVVPVDDAVVMPVSRSVY
ncbi:MAG TPA: hypothetical protein VF175_10550 [Lacipirellula sp.]